MQQFLLFLLLTVMCCSITFTCLALLPWFVGFPIALVGGGASGLFIAWLEERLGLM